MVSPRPIVGLRGPVSVQGLDMWAVSEAIRENLGQVSWCYDEVRGEKPLAGELTNRSTVAPDGTVTSVEIENGTITDEAIRTCLLLRVKKWRFAVASAQEMSASVKFTLEFRSTPKRRE